MAYELTFFCRTGEDNGQAAMARLIDELLTTGTTLLNEQGGPYVDAVASHRLAIRQPDGTPAADWLRVELHVGVEFIAESVMDVSPDNEQGIWGCDLMAIIMLVGDNPDWPLVNRIWIALTDLWSAVAWDELSGFEIAASMPGH